jgi:hypothetical protein
MRLRPMENRKTLAMTHGGVIGVSWQCGQDGDALYSLGRVDGGVECRGWRVEAGWRGWSVREQIVARYSNI